MNTAKLLYPNNSKNKAINSINHKILFKSFIFSTSKFLFQFRRRVDTITLADNFFDFIDNFIDFVDNLLSDWQIIYFWR